jgi:hypothetical protein
MDSLLENRQIGAATEIKINPAMVSAGVMMLRREFGGESEGVNRFVDFRSLVEEILALSSICYAYEGLSDQENQNCCIR